MRIKIPKLEASLPVWGRMTPILWIRRSEMAGVTLEEARRRYSILYDVLSRAGGVDGLHTWEKNFVQNKLSHYQIKKLLKQNFSRSPEAFNDYAQQVVPPDELAVQPGLI
jgi:hypothetical protein